MSVCQCVLRIEVDEDLPDMGDNPADVEAAQEHKQKDRGCRDSKTITVETYASVLEGSTNNVGILPPSCKKNPPEDSPAADNQEIISFFCGNPLIEVTKGILHLYKENEMKEHEEGNTLCLLSVPGSLGAPDLLAFAAACQQDIAHVRVLRDGSPDHYMALLTFRSSEAAREFRAAFDGAPYSLLEPSALCRTAWVARVECARGGWPPPAHAELPVCPVCLDRLDESVLGVLSVQCAHSFHADCLMRWGDASCPVCRCAQTPEPRAHATCLECRPELDNTEGSTGDESGCPPQEVAEGVPDGVEAGSLWICLICGHIGCGRYESGHAAKHFLATNHTYAMQLGSNRVWDYAGDNFVHRLVQNKTDGKLVEAGGAGGPPVAADKLDAAQLELSYCLTHQLDTQRQYYEDRIASMKTEYNTATEELEQRAAAAEGHAEDLKAQLQALSRDNVNLERKLHQLTVKVSSVQASLEEERALAGALAAARAAADARENQLREEVKELKEQLRDVMFFVEARDRLQTEAGVSSQELQGAAVSVPAPTLPARRRKKK